MSLSSVRDLVVSTVRESLDDDVPSLGAAIAYYTVFSLPSLLAIVVGIAGAAFGPDVVERAITGQIQGLIGPDAAEAIRNMIANASDLGNGIGSKVVGLVALLFGATGAFGQLQKALNRAWEVEETAAGLRNLVLKRVLSFGMIVTLAFLLLVSLAVSAVLSALGDAASAVAPEGWAQVGVQILNVVVSLGVVTLLFAAVFRVLPDLQIAWRDVWVGALVTALLFTVGKTALGLYIGTAQPGSAFGAAGSLALILVWIYYSALIVLVGAEFTQVWARRRGSGADWATPDDGGPRDEPPADEPPADAADEAPAAASLEAASLEAASSGITRR